MKRIILFFLFLPQFIRECKWQFGDHQQGHAVPRKVQPLPCCTGGQQDSAGLFLEPLDRMTGVIAVQGKQREQQIQFQ